MGDRMKLINCGRSSLHEYTVVAHTMGGGISGTIDESVRHAITNLLIFIFQPIIMLKIILYKMGER